MNKVESPVGDEALGRPTLLVADNDRQFLDELREALENEGYDVIAATNPFVAKRILKQNIVDLALLDVRLRDEDDEKDRSGFIIAREVAPETPIILVTRHPYDDPAELKGLPKGITFVEKKAGLEAIVRCVRNVLASKRGTSAAAEDQPKHTGSKKMLEPSKWLAQRSPIIALICLLSALLAGVLAMVLENPILLIGTVVAAIIAVLFIGLSISIE